MSKVILVSQKPLPFHRIGSWTTLYKNYFESENSLVDIIVCSEPQSRFSNVEYAIVPNDITTKIKRKLTKKTYQSYIDTVLEVIRPNEEYIVQVVDNFGFVKALKEYLKGYPEIRKQLYIQFFYHGYPPYFGNFESRWFFEFIDEMVLLTKASYKAHKEGYTILPCMFSVMHNGIDTEKFFKPSKEKRERLKRKFDIEGKTVFLWCSQDRPKKGLELILNVWKLLIKTQNNIELWVLGANRDYEIKNVKFFGKMPNDELPEYYQAADCYLFPVLNHEGFGMSLIEALHSGNYCIASALGGIPEVLENGKYGTLVENPHFIEDWKIAIEDYLNGGHVSNFKTSDLYTKEKWINDMNRVIQNAKSLIEE